MAYSENVTANGDTAIVTITDAATKVRSVGISVVGTFDSASCQLKGRSIDDTSVWLDIGSAITANGQVTAHVCGVDQLKVTVGSIATAADLDIKIYGGKAVLTVTDN